MTGQSTQLVRQVGEHLVAARLGRLGLYATPFAGNVPDFDLVVADELGNSILVQVKAIQGGAWQFGDASKYLDIDLVDKTQNVRGIKKLANPNIIFVLVRLNEGSEDEFYVLTLGEIQEEIRRHYSEYLEKKGGTRPRNYKSLHCALLAKELGEFRDRWSVILGRFGC
jgi:hypothetical protein